MKILVLSLLRLGDVIMSSAIADELKSRYPGCTVHFLVNSNYLNLSRLFPQIDRFISFERDLLQVGLGERDRNIFEPYDRLEQLVTDLNEEAYDLLVNVTHNRMSGWLAQLIEADKKLGLVLRPDGSPDFGSKWFEHLNRVGSLSREMSFHFIDIFGFAVGGGGQRRIRIHELPEATSRALELTNGLEPYIVLQPFSSDQKKEWGFDNFVRYAELIHQVEPQYRHVILCSAGERDRAEILAAKFKGKGLPHRVVECDLATAYSVIKRAALLLTGDTSIKHLASASATPIVELSLGSSSYQRTGAYSPHAYILQSLEPCAPCSHSESCPYESIRCAKRLSAESVALVIQTVLAGRGEDLRTVATEFSDQVRIMKASFGSQNEWRALPIVNEFRDVALMEWIDRTTQRLSLNDLSSENLIMGTESLGLIQTFSSLFPERQERDWIEAYKRIGTQCDTFKKDLDLLLTELRIVIKNFDSEEPFERFKARIKLMLDDQTKSQLFRSFIIVLRDTLNESLVRESKFAAVKKVREVLTTLISRAELEGRLVRSLQNKVLERS